MSDHPSPSHDRIVAIAFTVWASAVTVAFLAANAGHIITKLTERGILG